MIRSLRMQPNRKLYFKELPMPPTPGPGEVQVRMAFASICGYDMMMLRGTAAYPLNGYLGHEGSGVVTASAAPGAVQRCGASSPSVFRLTAS